MTIKSECEYCKNGEYHDPKGIYPCSPQEPSWAAMFDRQFTWMDEEMGLPPVHMMLDVTPHKIKSFIKEQLALQKEKVMGVVRADLDEVRGSDRGSDWSAGEEEALTDLQTKIQKEI